MPAKERLFAHPRRPNAKANGGAEQLGLPSRTSRCSSTAKARPAEFVAKPLRKGARVVAGTVLGRIGQAAPSSRRT